LVLKSPEIKAFYDRFGTKQDTQAFYEDPALDDLTAHASFSEAEKIFEFGCGTGRFAARLVSNSLPADVSYTGCDVSRTMVTLATEKLAIYSKRAKVTQSDGTVMFPIPDHSVDRVVSTYVLDLLSEADTESFFREAYRVLNVGGRVCLISLTKGTTLLSNIVTTIWTLLFRLKASLVGGCRPVSLEQYLDQELWELEYRNIIIAFGVPSEILVARVKYSGQQGAAPDGQPVARLGRGRAW
jgi:ubiquinone/menaquinone biosynthesis C-methylase UbiE